MSIISSAKAQYYTVRFLPGQDLKKEIQNFCLKNQLSAACIVSAVGSLTQAEIRLASASESKKLTGPFEILNLSGTISLNGIHLHLSLADKNGQCLGGHLLEGCLIYTTLELVILNLPEIQFNRVQDSATGFKELQISYTK